MMISNEDVGIERPVVGDRRRQRSSFVLCNESIRGEPTSEHLWEHLLRTMARPGPHDPMRPSRIELSDSDGYDFLKPKLGELDIGCVLTDELPKLQQFCRSLPAGYGGPEKCALAERRCNPRANGIVLLCGRAILQQAPWKHVTGEIPIEIRCRGLDVGILYAIVLGRRE